MEYVSDITREFQFIARECMGTLEIDTHFFSLKLMKKEQNGL